MEIVFVLKWVRNIGAAKKGSLPLKFSPSSFGLINCILWFSLLCSHSGSGIPANNKSACFLKNLPPHRIDALVPPARPSGFDGDLSAPAQNAVIVFSLLNFIFIISQARPTRPAAFHHFYFSPILPTPAPSSCAPLIQSPIFHLISVLLLTINQGSSRSIKHTGTLDTVDTDDGNSGLWRTLLEAPEDRASE